MYSPRNTRRRFHANEVVQSEQRREKRYFQQVLVSTCFHLSEKTGLRLAIIRRRYCDKSEVCFGWILFFLPGKDDRDFEEREIDSIPEVYSLSTFYKVTWTLGWFSVRRSTADEK